MSDLNRKYAWHVIKSAIRTYAKEPNDQHAQKVEEAWQEMRQIEEPSFWREWQAARLNPGKGSEPSDQVH
jgi:hypothetical protein